MAGQPWMKFYPTDWRADPALRSCSLAARGLWMEMLGIMHEAEPRGLLTVNGRPVSTRHLSIIAGCSESETATCLLELEEAGVFSRKRNDVIYSRRMERDEQKSRKNADNGKKGGNPSLCKETENVGSLNPPDKGVVKAQKPEARSQSPDKKEGPAADAASSLEATGEPSPPDPIEADKPKLSKRARLNEQAVTAEMLRHAMDRWNTMAAANGLSQAAELNPTRTKKLRRRLLDSGGLDGWDAALVRVSRSSLCLGRKTTWKATFDFLLQESSFIKLMEGNYDDRADPRTPQQSRTAAILDAIGAGDDSRAGGRADEPRGAHRGHQRDEVPPRPAPDGRGAGNRYEARDWHGPEFDADVF